jgi:hypothetical protein
MNARQKLDGVHDAGAGEIAARPQRTFPTPLRGDEQAVASPAHQLQDVLGSELRAEPLKKWPPLGRLTFVVGGASMLWALIILGLRAL